MREHCTYFSKKSLFFLSCWTPICCSFLNEPFHSDSVVLFLADQNPSAAAGNGQHSSRTESCELRGREGAVVGGASGSGLQSRGQLQRPACTFVIRNDPNH